MLVTDLPDFIQTPFREALAAWQANTARTCIHSPTPKYGRGFTAVWKPDLVVCPWCTQLLGVNREEASTCDRCDVRVPQHPGVTTMHVGFVRIDGLTITFGICTNCRDQLNTP